MAQRVPKYTHPARPVKGKTILARLYPTLCHPMDCNYQAALSMGFSRQEHWTGLPCPPPEDLLDPGIKPGSPILQVDSSSSEPPRKYIYMNWYNCSSVIKLLLSFFLIIHDLQRRLLKADVCMCPQPSSNSSGLGGGSRCHPSTTSTVDCSAAEERRPRFSRTLPCRLWPK